MDNGKHCRPASFDQSFIARQDKEGTELGLAPVRNDECDPLGKYTESTYIVQLEQSDPLGYGKTVPDLSLVRNGNTGDVNNEFFSDTTRKGSNALIRLNMSSSDILSLAIECEFGQHVLEELVSLVCASL